MRTYVHTLRRAWHLASLCSLSMRLSRENYRRTREAAARPLKTRLTWLSRCLACALLPLFLSACDGGDGTPVEEPHDPITPEVRMAIEAGDLAALSDSDLPEIPGLDDFIIDHDMAVVLGKAFFWEMNTGNNGQACASCHFHAGTDRRIQNTLHPGGKDEEFFEADAAAAQPPFVFDPTRSGGAGGPNYTLLEGDFPFHVKANATDRESAVIFDSDDIVGSQGVLNAEFHSLGLDGRTRIGEDPGDNLECEPVADRHFQRRRRHAAPYPRPPRHAPQYAPPRLTPPSTIAISGTAGAAMSSTASTIWGAATAIPGCGR